MKKITIRIDDRALVAERRHAAERGTSVNERVRDFLGRLAVQHERTAAARLRIRDLSRRSPARLGRKS